jgi:uncharacterized peroxidase-related enzyme
MEDTMKNGYQIHSDHSCPTESRTLLGEAMAHYGFIPNAIGAMAESPAVLEAYLTLENLLAKTAFTDAERHVLLLAITREYECSYCVAAHSAFAKMAGLPPKEVENLRRGQSLDDSRMEKLHRFAAKAVAGHGQVSDADVQELLAVGFNRRQVLEVLLLIANKLIAVYANRIMGTDLDAALQGESWTCAA